MVAGSHAATCYVSPTGADTNPGTKAKPFRSIQAAADVVKAGDTCTIRGGVYREGVALTKPGRAGKPIRFVAEPGEVVTLDGTEPVTGTWTRYDGNIYKVRIDAPVVQLFVGREMMVEARWPNMDFETQLFSREAWASTVAGSRYGSIKDPELAETNIDWTGALITMNVAHQFFSWTRTVNSHSAGEDTLTYPRDLQGVTHYGDKTKGWEDDYYFLSGKLEALDSPGEWFYDGEEKLLYFYPPDGKSPKGLRISYRARQYAISGKWLQHIELSGFNFFSCTFDFEKCNDMVIERCRIRFPAYSRHVKDPAHKEKCRTSVVGNRNTVRHCSLGFSSHAGLNVAGRSNLVEECLIHDVCWHGSLGYPGLAIYGEANTARRNTIFNGGNALLQCPGGNQVVEYNHVYDGGLLCRDVSLVYTQLPRCRGTVIRYNWVHGCMTEGFSGHTRAGGIGIRGDDQTRGLTVHHNVVWDCGKTGIIVKGDDNRVFNNTIFDIGPRDPSKRMSITDGDMIIPTRAEPEKPWRDQHPLLDVQSANSFYVNNAIGKIVWRKEPLPPSDKITHNLEFSENGIEDWIVDPKQKDFRPRKGSPLIDAGRVVPGLRKQHSGTAPDVGAYEYGQKPWTAGITWDPGQH